MLNRCVLMGRLTRDPEMRRAGETPVCSFSIACDRDYKNKDGDRDTDFIDIVAWRKTAELVGQHFTKGRMAIVEGRLQVRAWTDKEGNKRRTAEIVADNVYFADSKPKPADPAEDDFQLPEGFDMGEIADDSETPF